MRKLKSEDLVKMGLRLHALDLRTVNELRGLIEEYTYQASTAGFSIILEKVEEIAAKAYDSGF